MSAVHELDGRTTLVHGDSRLWLLQREACSVHAVVTDPPYGFVEYEEEDHEKLRSGKGGVWRIPPTLDGKKRAPLPRFTVLDDDDLAFIERTFLVLGKELARVLVPGGHVLVASNPLVSSMAFRALVRGAEHDGGLEVRGTIVRMVQTLRGGDRPKGAHEEFPDVTVMPRSCWEPWGLFRKPCEGTVAQNLRKWKTGALRRISGTEPFKDVVPSAPARGRERALAPHPSLKPQRFLRHVVRAMLPLEEGIVLDPFAGSGSTLAAASSLGYRSVGVERDEAYFRMAREAFEGLRDLELEP